MRNASAALTTLLNNANGINSLVIADLYTITLYDGTVLRWTTFDRLLTFGGKTWLVGPLIERTAIKTVIGTEVDAMKLMIRPTQEDLYGSAMLGPWIIGGGLDGAKILLERGFMSSPMGSIVGTLVWFVGNVAQITGGRTGLEVEVKSDLERLNVQSPRNYFSPDCSRVFGDAGCGVSQSAITSTGTVTSVGSQTFGTSLTSAVADYYDLGVITFTSGANNGVTRSIKSQAAGGVVTVVPALPSPAAVGDTFSIRPGCNKTQGNGGCLKFYPYLSSVQLHHRGFPYVPPPETSVA